MSRTRVLSLVWSVFVLAALHLRPAVAGVPTDQVCGTIERVLRILQDPALKSMDKHRHRREQLTRVISARCDFADMARRSLGSEWRRLTRSQQQEFVELFTDLLRDAYLANIESYKGENMIYKSETQQDEYAVVQTIIRPPEGAEYAVEYRLHLVDKEWKVYDLVIENVSLVNNYRSQFARMINKSSYEGLVRALRENASKRN